MTSITVPKIITIKPPFYQVISYNKKIGVFLCPTLYNYS